MNAFSLYQIFNLSESGDNESSDGDDYESSDDDDYSIMFVESMYRVIR